MTVLVALREDTVGTNIDGFDVELEFFIEAGEQRCFGNVSYRDEVYRVTYSGSLTLLQGHGWLDPDRSEFHSLDVADVTINKITEWADANGY